MGDSYKVQSIVVGVDFSKYSKSVVDQARSLASKWELPLVLVHGFQDPFVSEGRYDDIISHMVKYYKKRVAKFYQVTDKEKVEVKCGSPSDQILKIAKKYPKPLIVVGHKGDRNVLTRLFIGSAAEKVAQNSPYPVWIHRCGKVTQLNKVLIPCDLSDRALHTEKFLKKMRAGKTQTELLHVVQPAVPLLDYQAWKTMNKEIEEANEAQRKTFKKKHPALKIKEVWGDVFSTIESHAKHFDAIALSPRSAKSFFEGFGSVTSKIVRSSEKPVLIIP